MENLEIWEKLEKTNPALTKQFDNGRFKGTAISPVYCYQKMTEVFGPVGKGWKVEFKKERITVPSGEMLVYVDCFLYTREKEGWSEAIPGSGGDYIYRLTSKGPKSDDDAEKKASTDAMTNAMKLLGMSADVHMGRFDDNKYVEALKDEFKKDTPKDELEKKEFTRDEKMRQRDLSYDLSLCKTVKDVEEFLEDNLNLPDFIGDSAVSRIKGLKSNVSFPPAKYGFIDVAEALEFGTLAKKNIEEGPIDGLENWLLENHHKIKALDTILTAKKYNENGTPSERLDRAYTARIQPLTQAAE